MVRGKKMKNPLRKRLPRELKTEFGKYLVIFLLLVATIGLVSGFLVADGSMLKAYNEFESRVEHLKNRTLSKPERIKAMIDQKVGKITKKEIMDAHPDISKTTVERTLADLVKSEYIAKVGSGPATGYVKI